jgi:hypothetical protein
MLAAMASWLSTGDRGKTPKRWLIVGTILSILILIFTFTPPFRPRHHGEMAFPTPHSEHGYAQKIHVKEFVKPKGVKIIGLVFFGRRNRVEMLKCFIEVWIFVATPLLACYDMLITRTEKPC